MHIISLLKNSLFFLLLSVVFFIPQAAHADEDYRWVSCSYVKITDGAICEPRCITRSIQTAIGFLPRQNENIPPEISAADRLRVETACNFICAIDDYEGCEMKEIDWQNPSCDNPIGAFQPSTPQETNFADNNNPLVVADRNLAGIFSKTSLEANVNVCQPFLQNLDQDQGPNLPLDNPNLPLANQNNPNLPPPGNFDPQIVNLTNPLQGNPDINTIIGRVISAILGIIGSITLVAFIYGGVLWLTSAGNDGRIKKGLNTMVYAVIGLFIIFAAYAILNTIISALR